MTEPGTPERAAHGRPAEPGTPERAGHAQPAAPGTEEPAGQQAEPGPGLHHPADPWQQWVHRADPWQWVHRAEHLAAFRAQKIPVPAWLRKTPGERRWPVTLTVVVAIVLQVLLPSHLIQPLPRALLPALEGALLVGLSVANPVRVERRGKAVRAASIALILVISLANAVSAVLLIRSILDGRAGNAAGVVLASGASVWATNVIAFALWYWEFDRGGPVNRALAARRYPDFLFPQMASPGLAPSDWEPRFVDYLYFSFTNATAFSPTDVMPLARWAKLTMLVQSGVSLAIGALVIARAINILPS